MCPRIARARRSHTSTLDSARARRPPRELPRVVARRRAPSRAMRGADARASSASSASASTRFRGDARRGRRATRARATARAAMGDASDMPRVVVPEAYVRFAEALADAAGETTTKYFRARGVERRRVRPARARDARTHRDAPPRVPARAAMADTNRIMKGLREIASDVASQVVVTQHGDSLVHMKGTIAGASSRSRAVDAARETDEATARAQDRARRCTRVGRFTSTYRSGRRIRSNRRR